MELRGAARGNRKQRQPSGGRLRLDTHSTLSAQSIRKPSLDDTRVSLSARKANSALTMPWDFDMSGSISRSRALGRVGGDTIGICPYIRDALLLTRSGSVRIRLCPRRRLSSDMPLFLRFTIDILPLASGGDRSPMGVCFNSAKPPRFAIEPQECVFTARYPSRSVRLFHPRHSQRHQGRQTSGRSVRPSYFCPDFKNIYRPGAFRERIRGYLLRRLCFHFANAVRSAPD